jgi:hypothetical protein
VLVGRELEQYLDAYPALPGVENDPASPLLPSTSPGSVIIRSLQPPLLYFGCFSAPKNKVRKRGAVQLMSHASAA